MPSRRSILAAATVAASAGLAGCSGAPSSGVDATIRDDAVEVLQAESAPVVARDEATGTVSDHGCPEGLVNARSRVHERSRDGGETELVLVSEYRVIPGENVCASRGWRQAGITARHRWAGDQSSSDIRGQSNVVPAEGNGWLRLERDQATDGLDWRVHADRGRGNTTTYVFRSRLGVGGERTEGNALASTRAEARVRDGGFGGSGALATTMKLVYGRTER